MNVYRKIATIEAVFAVETMVPIDTDMSLVDLNAIVSNAMAAQVAVVKSVTLIKTIPMVEVEASKI